MQSITEIVKQFKQNWTEEINSASIEQACRDCDMTWIDSSSSRPEMPSMRIGEISCLGASAFIFLSCSR